MKMVNTMNKIFNCQSLLIGHPLYWNFAKSMKDTVKPVLSGHIKMDKPKVLKTNGSLMKVESIAECSLLTCIKQKSVLKTKFLSSF